MFFAFTWLLTGNYPSRKEACVLSGKKLSTTGKHIMTSAPPFTIEGGGLDSEG
jgi:hypothetical protein